MGHRLIVAAAAAAVLGAAASGASAATTFTGGYTETHNTADPGLIINTQPVHSAFSFNLNPGQSASVDLFKIYTNEESVNVGEDTVAKPINVTFSFTSPTNFDGSIGGTTNGETSPAYVFGFKLDGYYQNGVLTWSNGGDVVLGFGAGGQLGVHLNNVDFNNGGLWGLDDGKRSGGLVTATFTEIKGAVPEPATWASMIVGLFGAGAVLRRARKDQAFGVGGAQASVL